MLRKYLPGMQVWIVGVKKWLLDIYRNILIKTPKISGRYMGICPFLDILPVKMLK